MACFFKGKVMEDLIIEFEEDIKDIIRHKRRHEYNIKNREKNKKYNAEYRIKNKENIKKKLSEYRAKNREKIKSRVAEYARKNSEKLKEYRRLKKDFIKCKKYGLNEEWYKEKLIEQNGKCAICGTDKPGGFGKKLHIDHCHKTQKVRGLLCSNCNTAIGYLQDSISILESAKQYLIKHQ
jgi:hypothetical protein